MKHGWEYTSFGDIICPAKNIRNSDGADLPVLSITMHGGIVKQNERFKKVIASRDTANYKVVKRGQLVIAFPIDEGLIYTQEVADKGIMSPAYNVYDIDCTNINRHFLVTFLHSPFAMKYYKDKLRGTTQRRRMLPKEDLYALSIPLPPLPVQEQICSLLDKMNRVIDAKKEQLKELDNLAQSLFYEMFGDPIANVRGWDVEELNEVCDVRDGTHDSPKYIDGGEYILITSKNIVDGRIDYSNINYITKEDYDAINKRSKVDDGDIIMAMIGTIGKPIIVKKEDYKFCIKNVALIKFCKESRVNNVYIQALLNSSSFSQYIVSKNQGGTQKFVALGTIRKLPIPVPPLPLQQSFAEKVEAIEQQKQLINQSIKDVQTLFDAKMDYYFGD